MVVVDDESTDATVENAIRAGSNASRFRLIKAGLRPADERWVGKNWACSKAVEQVSSDWLLFIDADVRLKPDALQRALAQAVDEHADLLSLAPRLSCGCLAEWMVQPIMASLLGLGFPILETNDPESPVAFAAGPFMLFKASTYECIGGHRALAGEVVEDLALARAIKAGGYRLSYLLGLDAVDLRMYADLAALWEGWTKNWFLGLDRDPAKAIGAALVVVLMFTVPWLLLPTSLVLLWLQPVLSVAWLWLMALAGLAIVQQLLLRLWTRSTFDVPIRYWYLAGFGWFAGGCDRSRFDLAHTHGSWLDLERTRSRLKGFGPFRPSRVASLFTCIFGSTPQRCMPECLFQLGQSGLIVFKAASPRALAALMKSSDFVPLSPVISRP